MDEEPPEVLGVLLDAMVERLDLLLLQEPEHPLLELPRALARDDLDERAFFATASSMIACRARSMSCPQL
jgi:hypothetical protein